MRHPHLTLVMLLLGSCAAQVEHEPIVAYHEPREPPQFIEAPDALGPPEPRAELFRRCAEESLAEFNESESPTALPLRRAVSCFDAAGLWVQATKVQKVLNEQFLDHADPHRELVLKARAFEVMEHPVTARQTLWGQHCLEQRGRSERVTTALRVECAKQGQFTTWVVELCGPADARAQLDGPTRETCEDYDGFLVHLEKRVTEGR